MGVSFFVPRAFTAADTLQMKLFVHIFMNRSFAYEYLISCKKNTHTPMAKDSAEFMIDILDFTENLTFLCMEAALACFK